MNPVLDDPLHTWSGPDTFWTTVNAAEAMPGVVTPLTWTFYAPTVEIGVRQSFYDLGILGRREVRSPADPDERLMGIFHGRAAMNLDVFRTLADRVPGQSGDAIEMQLFGTVRPGVTSTPSRRRYPVVAAKAPVAVSRIRRRLTDLHRHAHLRWIETVGPTGLRNPSAATQTLVDARTLVQQIFRPHGLGSQVVPAVVAELAEAARRSGHPGLELRLLSGAEEIHESRMLTDLWSAGRGRLDLAAVIAEHGYHGPNEGELAAPTWREEPQVLKTLCQTYATMPESESPAMLRERRLEDMAEARELLLDGLGTVRRRQAQVLLGLAQRFVPLREVGRSAFLQGVDIARAASRVLGSRLAADGHLDHAADVAFLTYAELIADQPPSQAKSLVEYRRARFEEYQGLLLPDSWTGQPEPLRTDSAESDGGDGLTGLPVCPGIVEGVARVVTDPCDVDALQEGDILVCPVTNPSWASLFLVAGAIVIDTGGPLSHGAIVARELGLPCVINTRTGTRRIRTGDRVRVDGSAGTVEVLSRPGDLGSVSVVERS